MKEIIKKIIAEFWDKSVTYIPRKKITEELATAKSSIIITGPRRAGKSYTIYELRDMIMKKGAEKQDFLCINFEDERLSDLKKEQLDLLLEAYYEMRDRKPIIFLDEIQNIVGWEKFIRRLADDGYKVVATGSNSEILSMEIANRLGGRFLETEIYPLDFKEFLTFKKMEIRREYLYSKERFKLKKYFDEYLLYGGFPEVAFFSEHENKIKVIKTYFNLVFYKDLIAKKELENETALRFIIKKLRENIGNIITPRAIYASLKNAGIEAGPNTVEKYIQYLEEAFLIIPCKHFAKSVSKQEKKKRYFVDNGYIKIFEVKEDLGLLLENLVFTEFIKKGKDVGYYQGKKECDFIVEGREAVQVAYNLNEENEGREVEGIIEAMKVCGLEKGIIITYDQEREIEKEGKKIQVVPAWKWALSL